MSDDAIVILYCPCPDLEAAKRLGNGLLDARLAGCVNILPGMVSLYDWQGLREEASEAVLIAKTSVANAPAARANIAAAHPYAVPAILTLPVVDVNAPYADWLRSGMAG